MTKQELENLVQCKEEQISYLNYMVGIADELYDNAKDSSCAVDASAVYWFCTKWNYAKNNGV